MKRVDFLYSGFDFSSTQELLKFQVFMLNMMGLIIIVFSALFGFMSDFGINYLGPIHSKVNYVYSFSSFCILLYLRASKEHYAKAAHLLLLISYLTFISALVNVPQDEFRIIWFYLLVYVAYMLLGTKIGMAYTFASVLTIIVANYFIDLQLSQVAINSGFLGLIIGSLLSKVYTDKITQYELALQEKNKSLEDLASLDGLTGLVNKRKFNELADEAFKEFKNNKKTFSVLVLDIDNFKEINDEHGHVVGDKILQFYVKTLTPLLRKSDIFARFGGDEFTILLRDTNSNDATYVARKICTHIANKSALCEECENSFTTSVGYTEVKASDRYFSEVFERADKALYQAKSQGRNRAEQML
ncbi:MAG: GGDEF domain-containing protein [Campylobacterales bacterium]|nr:GGDEF domain-containing protein [Campylobacterales bacterium]